MVKDWRVTLERVDGSYYVRDEQASCSAEAIGHTLAAYRAKYGTAPDSEWPGVFRVVEIERGAHDD